MCMCVCVCVCVCVCEFVCVVVCVGGWVWIYIYIYIYMVNVPNCVMIKIPLCFKRLVHDEDVIFFLLISIQLQRSL